MKSTFSRVRSGIVDSHDLVRVPSGAPTIFPLVGRDDYADTHNVNSYPPRQIVPHPGQITSPYLPYDMPVDVMLGMKRVKISLAAAGIQKFAISGNVLWVPYSTNATDLVEITINGQSDPIPATRGWFVAGCKFSGIEVNVTTAVAGATMYLAYSHDPHEEKVRIQ